MDMMKRLPNKEREVLEMEERKLKKLKLQEIKQNLWWKWRGRKEEKGDKEENDIERQTAKIETILEKIEEEKKILRKEK